MKCQICSDKIEETFLGKINGTYVDKKAVCFRCQSKLSLEEIKEKL
ncbi:MAG: hypothetical protein ACMXX9_02460 [Candidatus Woesearchaeota archaeon]